MFRITEDPSSGSIVQCLAKNYKNDSIESPLTRTRSVLWQHIVRVCSSLYMKALTSYTVNYTHAQRVRICCHNTDLIHVSGLDRIILVIFSQALYNAP